MAKKLKHSELEQSFAYALQLRGLLKYFRREQEFIPGRKFRLDFADLEHKIGIEVQGAVWSDSRRGHSWGPGIERDHEKLNLGHLHGWRIFQFSDKPIKTGDAAELLETFYRSRGWL